MQGHSDLMPGDGSETRTPACPSLMLTQSRVGQGEGSGPSYLLSLLPPQAGGAGTRGLPVARVGASWIFTTRTLPLSAFL